MGTSLNGLIISVLIYEFLVIGGIGFYLSREAKKGKDSFLLSGRDLPVFAVGVTLALTVLGSAHIFGLMETAWHLGAVSMWFSFAHVILIAVVCLGTGRWVRRLNVSTVPELIEMLYGPKIRIITACIMAPTIFGLLTMETQAIGIAFASMTGWSIQKGAIIGGIIGVFYVVLAGMKEIAWINLINTVVMYLGMIIAAIYLAKALPGQNWDYVSEYYVNEGQPWMTNIFGTPDLMFTFSLGVILSVVFAQGISQMTLQTAMSAKSERTVKKSLWIAAIVNGVFGVFAVCIGLAAKALPEFHALGPKLAGATLIVELLPNWVVVWLLASFLGALLSTFAMTAITPATIFVKDLYVKIYEPEASDEKQTRLARIVIIVLSILAIVVAMANPPIVSAITWLFAWLIPVFWIVIIGLFWKRSTIAATVTLSVCWIVNLLWSFTSLPGVLGVRLENAHVIFILSIVLGFTLSAFTKGERGLFRKNRYEMDLEKRTSAMK